MPMWNQSRIRGATQGSTDVTGDRIAWAPSVTTSTIVDRTQPRWSSAAATSTRVRRALGCARESSSRYPVTFDAARDNFKLAHILLRNRGGHGAVADCRRAGTGQADAA